MIQSVALLCPSRRPKHVRGPLNYTVAVLRCALVVVPMLQYQGCVFICVRRRLPVSTVRTFSQSEVDESVVHIARLSASMTAIC